MKRIDQLLAGYSDGDAISEEARLFRQAFRRLGYASEIFACKDHIAADVRNDCLVYEDFDPTIADAVIIQYATSSGATALFRSFTGRRILRYHNITPPSYFNGYDDRMAAQLAIALDELKSIASQADALWPVSAYNAKDLETITAIPTRVLPLLFDVDAFRIEPDAKMAANLDGPQVTWLFVGRPVPNKCIEEIIAAFAWYHRAINPVSNLLIVGSEYSCPRYYQMLQLFAERLELENVQFTGFVSFAQRAAIYQRADVFVSASRHEGYCLPLVEAMTADTPVIARRQGGMPEAMGQGGVLFGDLEPEELGELVHLVLTDTALNAEVLASQRNRIAEIAARDIEGELSAMIDASMSA